jgi:hypothetical protein
MSVLRPGFDVADELRRDRLVKKIRRVVKEIQLDLNTIAHWNRIHPEEAPLDYPDEDGALEAAFASIGVDFQEMKRKAGLPSRSPEPPQNT